MKYNAVVREGDNATVDSDYKLYETTCVLELDESPGGCVLFTPGQTIATLNVLIIPDHLLEGNERFHLRIVIVRNGKRSTESYLSTLQVIILDATRCKIPA